MVPDATDEALLRASVRGQPEAFDTLMRRHEDKIFGLALRMTGNRHDALDATQEAFVSAFRNASRFKGDSAFGTWLYRIAINACTDLLRKRQRQIPTEEVEAGAAPGRTDDEVALRMDLHEALAKLGADHREAVLMHDVGGYPYEDIAALTGVELGTVKSRISRGRKKLAEILEHRDPREPSKETR